MALPIITTPEDVRGIVAYLKTKATGATLAEAQAVVKRQLLDGRKLAAYVSWGVVTRDGDRLSLSARGWDFARSSDQGRSSFREIIDAVPAYRSALEWFHHQGLEAATNVDVAAHWHTHHKEAVGTANENTLKDSAVCFFHLCEAAGFGKLTLGRKGNTTRFTLNRAALQTYVDGTPGPHVAPEPEPEPEPETSSSFQAEPDAEQPLADRAQPEIPTPRSGKLRVFISHGGSTDMVEQVQTMLGLADMEGEVAEAEETTAIPVPQKVLDAMRRCQAGIIVVAVDERHKEGTGAYALNDNVLIEIGAAFVLYDRRVVLVWDRRLPVPSNLQGLYRCEFEGDELSWAAGMKLMKAIQGFKGQGAL